jgi:molecular chaperone GrpE
VREELRAEEERVSPEERSTGRARSRPDPDEPGIAHELDPTEPAGEGDPETERARDAETERPEPLEEEPGEGDAEAAEDPLTKAQRERDEYLALAQRAQADFENYRKRAAREAAAAGERAKAGLVRELLPIVDNLERALASAHAEEDHLAQGVRLVHSELVAVLERSGVEAFDPRGEPFDPTLHEALSTRPADGAEPGVVVEVVEKGYRSGDSVVRPARVVVSA